MWMSRERLFYIEWDRTSFDTPMWVCTDEGYLYMHETLSGVLYQLDNQYKHDIHLVG